MNFGFGSVVDEVGVKLGFGGVALSRNKVLSLMLLSVVGDSFAPLFVALGGGQSPFMFMLFWRAGAIAALMSFLLISYRSLLLSRCTWSLVRRRVFTWTFGMWLCEYASLGFYVCAALFINVAIIMVLHELWPVAFLFLAARLFRRDGRYWKISLRTWMWGACAFCGAALVILGQAQGIGDLSGVSLVGLGFGVFLALVSSVVASFSVFGLRWSADFVERIPDACGHHKKSLELFAGMLGSVIGNFVTGLGALGVGVARGEDGGGGDTLMYGLIGGFICNGLATIVWRKANLTTRNLNINLLSYLMPAFSLVWLFAFSQVGDVNGVLLVVGSCAIVAANVGIYFDRTR